MVFERFLCLQQVLGDRQDRCSDCGEGRLDCKYIIPLTFGDTDHDLEVRLYRYHKSAWKCELCTYWGTDCNKAKGNWPTDTVCDRFKPHMECEMCGGDLSRGIKNPVPGSKTVTQTAVYCPHHRRIICSWCCAKCYNWFGFDDSGMSQCPVYKKRVIVSYYGVNIFGPDYPPDLELQYELEPSPPPPTL